MGMYTGFRIERHLKFWHERKILMRSPIQQTHNGFIVRFFSWNNSNTQILSNSENSINLIKICTSIWCLSIWTLISITSSDKITKLKSLKKAIRNISSIRFVRHFCIFMQMISSIETSNHQIFWSIVIVMLSYAILV